MRTGRALLSWIDAYIGMLLSWLSIRKVVLGKHLIQLAVPYLYTHNINIHTSLSFLSGYVAICSLSVLSTLGYLEGLPRNDTSGS